MNNWDIENNKYVRHRYKIIYQTTLPGCRLELEAAREIRGLTSLLLLLFPLLLIPVIQQEGHESQGVGKKFFVLCTRMLWKNLGHYSALPLPLPLLLHLHLPLPLPLPLLLIPLPILLVPVACSRLDQGIITISGLTVDQPYHDAFVTAYAMHIIT